jgi:hypothetical protein
MEAYQLPDHQVGGRRSIKSFLVCLCWVGMDAAALALSGHWRIDDKTDALYGTRSYTADLLSDSTITNSIGGPERGALGFTCDRRAFFASISWPDLVDDQYITRSAPVHWKLDDGQPQNSSWLATPGGVTLLRKTGLDTLQAWSTGHKLIVEIPDYHGGQEATSTLDGIVDVYKALSQRDCGPQ